MKTLIKCGMALMTVVIVLCLSSCGDDPEPSKVVDVYLGGQLKNSSGVWQATYWKNGEPNAISTGYGYIEQITVSTDGKDVYAFGTTDDDTPYWTIWKNGVATTMAVNINANSSISDIAVYDGDLYMVGGDYDLVQGVRRPAVWINGVSQLLEDNTMYGNASDICVVGDDLYILANPRQLFGENKIVYWKNGTRTEFAPVGNHWAGSIAVSGSDIYLLGEKENEVGFWKNGSFTALAGEDPYNWGYSNELVVLGKDVYVVGDDEDPATGNSHACYWKNGTKVQADNVNDYSSIIRIAASSKSIYAIGYFETSNWFNVFLKDWQVTEPAFSTTDEDAYVESIAIAEY